LCPLARLETENQWQGDTRNAALRPWIRSQWMLDFFWPYIEMLYMGVVGFQFLDFDGHGLINGTPPLFLMSQLLVIERSREFLLQEAQYKAEMWRSTSV